MSDSTTNTTGHHKHPPHLQHHFDTPVQQFESVVQGMWLFLATEILLFGGLFCAYAVFRANHPEIFQYAHKYLSVQWGAINTVILLCSSFTMAAGVWAAQRSRNGLLIFFLILTLACGCGFLGVKYIEYVHKWKDGLMWGRHYKPHASPEAPGAAEPRDAGAEYDQDPVADEPAPSTAPTQEQPEGWMYEPFESGPRGLLLPERTPLTLSPDQRVRNVQLFFAVYFAMTGLHGLHVIAGLFAIGWITVRAWMGHFSGDYFTPVPMVGLYWHVVDLVWIYLFPLLYLIH